MPTLLIHSLLAAAIQSLLNLVIIGQAINEFTFYAAIMSILVDLDHSSDGKRSSIIHSMLAILVVLVIGVVIALLLEDVWMKLFVSSMMVGFASHVSIDAIDRGGILVMPWKGDVVGSLKGSKKRRGHRTRKLHLVLAVLSTMTLLILVLF